MQLVKTYNPNSRTRHFNKSQSNRKQKYGGKFENNRLISNQFKVRKRELTLKELDYEIRTVIVENVSLRIF